MTPEARFGSLPHPEPLPAAGVAENGLPRESVWAYPRPPRLEPLARRIEIRLGGELIARAPSGFRVLETSHPPSVYVPPESVEPGALEPAQGSSLCEWKGQASYYDVTVAARRVERRVYGYRTPNPRFSEIAGWLSFYAAPFECRLDDEPVSPQPGDFYAGWITAEIVGPFKGVPGSERW